MVAVDLSSEFQKTLSVPVNELMAHPLYAEVNLIPRLQRFMREHVFAVWDFMSLLKRLQRDFCGVGLPWRPPLDAELARFVNDIVLAEESDVDGFGGFTSHFELYLAAMEQIGADTGPIQALMQQLSAIGIVGDLLERLEINEETKAFVRFNLHLAEQGTTWEVAAAFCYGREDIIPEMFSRLLAPLAEQQLQSERFEYYLKRHVELDGETHGPLARKMVALLVDGDPGRLAEAQGAAQTAIEMRIRLWDGIMKQFS